MKNRSLFILIFKTPNTKCPNALLIHFASLNGVAPKRSKLGEKTLKFDCQTLNFDWPAENVFVTRVDR